MISRKYSAQMRAAIRLKVNAGQVLARDELCYIKSNPEFAIRTMRYALRLKRNTSVNQFRLFIQERCSAAEARQWFDSLAPPKVRQLPKPLSRKQPQRSGWAPVFPGDAKKSWVVDKKTRIGKVSSGATGHMTKDEWVQILYTPFETNRRRH